MKPHQLLAALMAREGIGPLPLAKKLGQVKLQAPIHRFRLGDVATPEAGTAIPLAKHYGVPLEAFYEERAATAVAKERGLSVVEVAVNRRKRASAPTDGPALAEKYKAMSPDEKQRFLEAAGLALPRKHQANS